MKTKKLTIKPKRFGQWQVDSTGLSCYPDDVCTNDACCRYWIDVNRFWESDDSPARNLGVLDWLYHMANKLGDSNDHSFYGKWSDFLAAYRYGATVFPRPKTKRMPDLKYSIKYATALVKGNAEWNVGFRKFMAAKRRTEKSALPDCSVSGAEIMEFDEIYKKAKCKPKAKRK